MKDCDKSAALQDFEQLLHYKFQNPKLLERALTHRSWAHERIAPGLEESVKHLHNESLEFVGDSVLGMTVAESLFERFPDADEGELTLMKHRLVSAISLAQAAEKLSLSDFLQMGRGEEKTGGRLKQTILADTMEAVIAAVFLDGGYRTAKDFVERIFSEDLQTITPATATDYKTVLQERLQAEKRAAPVYNVVRTEGPPHRRTFHVEAQWDAGNVQGSGTTIKTAAMMAAKLALEIIDTVKAETI
ncbi:MAG: ribonuclease III [Pyrinomonadaceae bacterium]